MDPTIPSQETESTTVYGNYYNDQQNCMPELTLDILIIIISLVGLAGNAVVLWLLGFSMRRNAIAVYILNLSVADFLLLSFRLIESLLGVIFYPIYNPDNDILANVAVIPYISGLSILSAISTERCLSILWPIWYHCHRPRNMSAVVCASIWFLSLLLSILEWYYSGFLTNFYDPNTWKNADYVIIAFLIFFIVVLCGSSLALLVRILCVSRRVPLTRLCMIILLTVLVYFICGLPFGLFWFLFFWFQILSPSFLCYAYKVSVTLSCVNSCANPIIYFFIGSFRRQQRQQHKTLKVILQRALQDNPELSECGDSCHQETLEMSRN